MQLPRGTFREIKKYVTIERLLADIEHAKFSGIANISSDTLTGTLVFKSGKCILVKFQNKPGDPGWDELQRLAKMEVDVALSSLDEAQIQLALEFNKSSRLVKAGKSAPSTPNQKPVHAVEPPKFPAQRKIAVPQKPQPVPPAGNRLHRMLVPPAAPSVPETKPAAVQSPPPYPSMNLRPPAPVPQASRAQDYRREEPEQPAAEEQPEESGATSFDDDIDTFDSMDLDNVTDKIRTDCQTMIKQLHLEHLMER